jgi:hypothetical protein
LVVSKIEKNDNDPLLYLFKDEKSHLDIDDISKFINQFSSDDIIQKLESCSKNENNCKSTLLPFLSKLLLYNCENYCISISNVYRNSLSNRISNSLLKNGVCSNLNCKSQSYLSSVIIQLFHYPPLMKECYANNNNNNNNNLSSFFVNLPKMINECNHNLINIFLNTFQPRISILNTPSTLISTILKTLNKSSNHSFSNNNIQNCSIIYKSFLPIIFETVYCPKGHICNKSSISNNFNKVSGSVLDENNNFSNWDNTNNNLQFEVKLNVVQSSPSTLESVLSNFVKRFYLFICCYYLFMLLNYFIPIQLQNLQIYVIIAIIINLFKSLFSFYQIFFVFLFRILSLSFFLN